eukprot:TRINITY_DN11391_c0_g4_i1.p1 TRINITY_DN11391_c0_g4~~TRINITY_DN11391_c0_g4_i1.p1  ORF type:complete len:504 (+),score=53.36 TRINITY_DN11391_c0_g4_i1:736-2247(+)
MITGSYDYKMRYWDFQGMNANMNSFRIVEVCSGQQVRSVSYNCDTQNVLAIVQGNQAFLLSKEGKKINCTVRGDMYLTDMAKTKGHTSLITDGSFSPTERSIFSTCSSDATIRIWDITKRLHGIEQQITYTNIIKCTDAKGLKVQPTCLQYTHDGKYIFVGCLDGSLQGFSSTKDFHRPTFLIRNQHTPQSDICSIRFFKNDYNFLSRSIDGSMKVWDTRNFKKALFAWYNLDTRFPGSKVDISPDQKVIVTGTSDGLSQETKLAQLHFFDAESFKEVSKITIGEDTITDIRWNSELNQIFTGCGSVVKVFYDPYISEKKGALQFVNKQPRQKRPEDIEYEKPIITPHSLPLFKEKSYYKQKKEMRKKIREEEQKLEEEQQEVFGKGKQGKVGGAQTLPQFFMKELQSAPDITQDPQEALLKLNNIAQEKGKFVSNAYKLTQPISVLDPNAQDVEHLQLLDSIQDKCPKCGLKVCTCSKRLVFELNKYERYEQNVKDQNKQQK